MLRTFILYSCISSNSVRPWYEAKFQSLLNINVVKHAVFTNYLLHSKKQLSTGGLSEQTLFA